MKPFGIESKFIAHDAKNVTQYRRFVTPWFYFNLKPRAYEFRSGFIFLPFTLITNKHKGWVDLGRDKWLFKSGDEDLINYLNHAVSELKPTNIVSFKR